MPISRGADQAPAQLPNDAQFYPVTREDLRSRLVDLNPDDSETQGWVVLGSSVDMNKRERGDFGGHGPFM